MRQYFERASEHMINRYDVSDQAISGG